MSSRRRRKGFRRRDALHTWSLHFGPNMTPMVDIVMVILVFFMASAAFVGSDWFIRSAMVVERGKGKAGAGTPTSELGQHIDVRLDMGADGKTVATMLELKEVPLAQLLERIRTMGAGASSAELQIIIRPAKDVPYSDVVTVHSAFHATGITKVGVGTRGVG